MPQGAQVLPYRRPDQDDEESLVLASIRGDVSAFARLYERYRGMLFGVCLRRTGSVTLAEDVVQDTFLRAFVNLSRFEYGKPIWPWLSRIAERRCIDLHRRTARVSIVDEVGEMEGGNVLGRREPSDTTLEAVMDAEDRREIERALAELPPRQRRALLLFAVEGWNYDDIASAECISVSSVKSLIFRARSALRRTCRTAPLVVLPPFLRRPRAAMTRMTERARQVTSSTVGVEGIGSIALHQFAVAALALCLAVSSGISASTVGAAATAPVSAALVSAPVGHAAPGNEGRVARPDDRGPGGYVRRLLDPSGDVEQPEDTAITSVVVSPAFAEDGVVLAAGRVTPCAAVCESVLFSSRDGGRTWTRLPGSGFVGTQVLVPQLGPASPIFAMGPAGLQVSEDGGASFRPAVPGAGFVVGSAAISPAFSRGDRTILVGAQTLVRYDGDLRAFFPAPYSALPGPLEPAFSPGYPADPRVVVGGFRVDAEQGVLPVVFSCASAVCSEARLPTRKGPPKIRLAPGFADGGIALAFTEDDLFVSSDGGASFSALDRPWRSGLLDVAVAPGGRTLFAAVTAAGAHAPDSGLYASRDAGRSWSKIDSPLFARGARVVTVADERVFVGLSRGVACSRDGGSTWGARC